jgi:hypothetical protein
MQNTDERNQRIRRMERKSRLIDWQTVIIKTLILPKLISLSLSLSLSLACEGFNGRLYHMAGVCARTASSTCGR